MKAVWLASHKQVSHSRNRLLPQNRGWAGLCLRRAKGKYGLAMQHRTITHA